MRDFTEDLAALARRVDEAREYLRIGAARVRYAELEEQASAPDLWDDAERARAVTSELARVRDDITDFDALDRKSTRLNSSHT